MAALPRKIHRRRKAAQSRAIAVDLPRIRLQAWQRVRTWARLIREAERLWHVDVRELKRLGALELSQLLGEIPPGQRQRVNRWLKGYAASTRLQARGDSLSSSTSSDHR
ncbi:MAG: hypothetical protein ACON4T_07370 [Synechococcus sp.]